MFSIIWLVVNCNGHLDRDLNDDDTIQTELLYQANTVSQEKRSDDQTQNTIDIPCFLYQKTLVIYQNKICIQWSQIKLVQH